jgi:uncharacterized protein (DUF302 family)
MLRTLTSICAAAAFAIGLSLASMPHATAAADNGVVMVKSRYAMSETIDRIKTDIAAKGITFFSEIDQRKLAADAGITLRPSTLLVFGNPGLGSYFITADAAAGIDWPVRLLISQDDSGQVWAIYTDFAYIAKRHGITSRPGQFAMASAVISSITSSVSGK